MTTSNFKPGAYNRLQKGAYVVSFIPLANGYLIKRSCKLLSHTEEVLGHQAESVFKSLQNRGYRQAIDLTICEA